MKVYIAERHWDCEGFEIIGVFTSEEAAWKACGEDKRPDGRPRGDDHEVEEFKLEVTDGILP